MQQIEIYDVHNINRFNPRVTGDQSQGLPLFLSKCGHVAKEHDLISLVLNVLPFNIEFWQTVTLYVLYGLSETVLHQC